MNLQHLCSAPHVTVYFDSWNNWLYLEWEGELTLPEMQHACLAIAHCFVTHAYPRVLNNNAQITSVEWDVAPWLAQHFFPYLGLAGIEQMAWVHGTSLRGRDMAEYTLSRLSTEVKVAVFGDLEDAVSWLQQSRPEYVSGCALLPRSATKDLALLRTVEAFEQDLEATRASAGSPVADAAPAH